MRAFGTPTVVNPFDRFGDHLRLALNAPASYQLLTWLEAGPGAELPERGQPPTDGRWVMCGYGRFGREVTADLRAAGPRGHHHRAGEQARARAGVIVGDASRPERAGPGRSAPAPSGWWPAPTTTRRTSPCWPPPGG